MSTLNFSAFAFQPPFFVGFQRDPQQREDGPRSVPDEQPRPGHLTLPFDRNICSSPYPPLFLTLGRSIEIKSENRLRAGSHVAYSSLDTCYCEVINRDKRKDLRCSTPRSETCSRNAPQRQYRLVRYSDAAEVSRVASSSPRSWMSMPETSRWAAARLVLHFLGQPLRYPVSLASLFTTNIGGPTHEGEEAPMRRTSEIPATRARSTTEQLAVLPQPGRRRGSRSIPNPQSRSPAAGSCEALTWVPLWRSFCLSLVLARLGGAGPPGTQLWFTSSSHSSLPIPSSRTSPTPGQ
jgi:hypothetical protein